MGLVVQRPCLVPSLGVRGYTSEERWEQILRVAGDMFSNDYLSSSLEDIAGRIGIQKASLYHYISSKEDILYELELRGHELGRSVISGWTTRGMAILFAEQPETSWLNS